MCFEFIVMSHELTYYRSPKREASMLVSTVISAISIAGDIVCPQIPCSNKVSDVKNKSSYIIPKVLIY
jgi:hypothetical protein